MTHIITVDPQEIKLTQHLVGQLIRKPALSEKLLNRPPFRFIHDIVKNIIQSTYYLKGLYNDEELISENIKCKEAKIKFLEKLINALGFINENVIDVSPVKIVSGLEPEKTNKLLQYLAYSTINKLSFESAVAKTLNGEKPIKSTDSAAVNLLEEKMKNSHTGKPVTHSKVLNQTKSSLNKNLSQSQTQSSPKTSAALKKKVTTNLALKLPKPQSPKADLTPKSRNVIKKSEASSSKLKVNGTEQQPLTEIKKAAAVEDQVDNSKQQNRVKSPVGQLSRPLTAIANGKPARIVSARPVTARAAPPKIVTKKSVDQALQMTLEESKFSTVSKPVENVISENEVDKTGDDIFLVTDSRLEEGEQVLIEKLTDEINDKKGSLVKQLVETKKELEGTEKDISQNEDNNLIKLAASDIVKLKYFVQEMTRLITPIGQLVNYLLEDIDSMMNELRSWREEYKQNIIKLKQDKIEVEKELEPLQLQLQKLDQEAKFMANKMRIKKASIIKSQEKLDRMLCSAVEKN